MHSYYENLTPEERADRVAEILIEGVLRLIEKKRKKANKIQSSVTKALADTVGNPGKIVQERT